MKMPSFIEGVVVAIALSVIGSAIAFVLAPLVGRIEIMYLLITSISFVYLVYLLKRSTERVGKITTVVLWLVVTGAIWVAGLPVLLLGVVQIGFIWLARSLYFYSGVLPALVDLGLTALSVVIAFWAATHSGSLFLGIWTFFLMQALYVVIPQPLRTGGGFQKNAEDDAFQRAYRNAEAAVRQLSTFR